MLSFHDEIHLGDMNTLVEATQNAGQVFVDFQYDDISLLDDSLCNARPAGQVEKTVPVHGRHTHHGHIYRQEVSVIGLQIPEDHRNVIAEPPVAECSLIGGTVPAVVAEMLPLRVGLDRHDRSEAKIAADLHVKKLIFALRQRRVQKRRKTDICTEIDPVSAFHTLYSLLRSPEFPTIFSIKIHILSQGLLFHCPAGHSRRSASVNNSIMKSPLCAHILRSRVLPGSPGSYGFLHFRSQEKIFVFFSFFKVRQR